MSQRIVITIAIDVPQGATVSVGGPGDALEDAPWPGGAGPTSLPIAAPSRPLADGPGECPAHRVPFTWKEGGVSKAGKAYEGFWKCGEKNPDQSFCSQKPAR